MPNPISWADLRGRRVAVWGLGIEGQATLRRLREIGVTPLEVDGTEAFESAFGQLTECDIVIKSPGISRYGDQCRRLVAAGVDVAGGIGLWLAGVDRSKVLCVTGTKGKSTTTAIAGGLLAGLGQRHLIGGNIGVPPWDPEVPQDVDWWVVETSSYQALDVRVGPKVVAVTSLSEDHLPWHDGQPDTYFRDKLSLCSAPGVEVVVAAGGDPVLRSQASRLGLQVEWVEGAGGTWCRGGRLLGEHNLRNAELARRALSALGVPGTDDEARLMAAFAGFEPLPHRLTPVQESGGVLFVDDSISTNALSALAAVESFPDRAVALLVGGLDRDIDYAPLAEGLRGRRDLLVLTMPTNGATIARALMGVVDVQECESLEQATRAAAAWAAARAGVVLLSPAAASFDRYADYQARGAAFVDIVRMLG
jgi:UDP-N-acetylmuramoylalanine--D-glutamate ligase